MKQRSLSKSKPWIYIPEEALSDDDRLPELRGWNTVKMEASEGDRYSDIANGLALAPMQQTNGMKRKRNQDAGIPSARTKRPRTQQNTEDEAATSHPKPTSTSGNKQPKSTKLQPLRHAISQVPSVQKVQKGDPFDVGAIGDTPPAKSVAHAKAQRSQSATSQKAPEAKKSAPITKRKGRPRKSTNSVAITKGPVSAIMNGRTGTGRKRGRPPKGPVRTIGSRKAPPLSAAVDDERVDGGESTLPQQQAKKQIPSAAVPEQDEEEEDPVVAEPDGVDDEIPPIDQAKHVDEIEDEEGEDEGSEHEREPHVTDGEDDDQNQMDLLGQQDTWDEILEASRSVPKYHLSTKLIRDLRQDIRDARQLYKDLSAPDAANNDIHDDLTKQLQDDLNAIEEQIDDLNEAENQSQRKEIICDMYSQAIPQMVKLMEAALALRTSEPRGLHRYSALEEIVQVQNMTVSLCYKARNWKAEPSTDQPIIKWTSRVILPRMRDMAKAFGKELEILRRKERTKENARKSIQTQKERQEQEQRDLERKEKNEAKRHEKMLRHHAEELEKHRNKKKGVTSVKRSNQIVAVQHTQKTIQATSYEWSEDEIIELCRELSNEAKKDLPGKISRYPS